MREIKDLNELKSIELEIMKKIHYFCVENDIKYFLSYGTLIGAIRHKGFIPWDDDIDILLPRPDYNKFVELFPKYAVDNDIYLTNNKTNPVLIRPYSKVCDARTVQYEPKYKDPDPRGVFVDVWPLDGLPKNPIKRFFYTKIMYIKYVHMMASLTNIDYIPKKNIFKRFLIKLFNKTNYVKLVDKYDKYIRKYDYDNSKYIVSSAVKAMVLKKELFDTGRLIDFEDTKFYIPSGYDRYLRKFYGDYMTPPPIDKQVPHHVINTYWKD